MKQIKAFLIKLVAIGVLTFSVFGIYFNATIGRLLLMTLVVAAVIFIGDLFILPKINQLLAALGDFAAYFFLYLALGNLVVEQAVPLILPAFTAAYFGTLMEAVYHIYVIDQLHEQDRAAPAPIPVRYQTEFAEESEIESKKEDQDKAD